MAKRSARRLRLRRALRILLLIALLGSVLYLLLEKSLTQVILNTAYAKTGHDNAASYRHLHYHPR